MIEKIGFMQGRLSPLVENKIQAFPWPYWQNEFEIAKNNLFYIMEWTLDQERLYENPLMTEAGRDLIKKLMKKYQISIPSMTGDCFMQSPFYKKDKFERKILLNDLFNIIDSCSKINIKNILIPLVDNGRLENIKHEEILISELENFKGILKQNKIIISFESDFEPQKLLRFIKKFDDNCFGITYDIGNSAALNFDPDEELNLYAHRIKNIHVKDRLLNGSSVPLGKGNANIPFILKKLKMIKYNGNLILQTARAEKENHLEVLCVYRDLIVSYIKNI